MGIIELVFSLVLFWISRWIYVVLLSIIYKASVRQQLYDAFGNRTRMKEGNHGTLRIVP